MCDLILEITVNILQVFNQRKWSHILNWMELGMVNQQLATSRTGWGIVGALSGNSLMSLLGETQKWHHTIVGINKDAIVKPRYSDIPRGGLMSLADFFWKKTYAVTCQQFFLLLFSYQLLEQQQQEMGARDTRFHNMKIANLMES